MNIAIRRATALATCLFASLSILSTALAEPYSWQVSGGYGDVTAGSAATAQNRLLRATYYLSPVNDSVGPYELAPFLNWSSYLSVDAGSTKLREEASLDYGALALASDDPPSVVPVGVNRTFSAFPSESGFDTSDYAVEGRYVWPASGWYAGARARRGDGDAAPLLSFFQTTTESRRSGLFAGLYFGPRTAVEVELESETMNEDVRMIVPGFDPLFGLPNVSNVGGAALIVDYEYGLVTDVERDNAAISVRHVGYLGGSTFEFSAGARASRTEAGFSLQTPPALVGWGNPADWPVGRPAGPFPAFAPVQNFPSEREREVSFSGALFPVQSLGVRLSASTTDHDVYGTSDRVGLSANWFFVRNAALGIELHRHRSARGYAPDSSAMDSVSVRVLGRF